MDETHGIECLWGDLESHPQCPHGPTLLFGRYLMHDLQKFYACSACRDRKLCNFYLRYGEELSKIQKNAWQQKKKALIQYYHHQKLFIRLNEIKAKSPENRCYCHSCEKLIFNSEKDMHADHEITENITDYQLEHPTELIKPLVNVKKEAQYLFSKKSTEDITNMLLKLGAKQVLCIGTPRIHEYIIEHHADEMSSLLLDFDGRFHNFFGPLDYCWYNLFNHHFFKKDAVNVFKDFITQNEGKDTYLICDPPFGGRVEPISYTLKTISDLHKELNTNDDENLSLKIMFMFPYFMENIMREKSNPLSINGGLKDLKMSDYKVDYDNHPLFTIKDQSKKQYSPVRIFTNIPLRLLELPISDGYKFCKYCKRWVSKENNHCKKCKKCTSKDGRTYKHCDICKRCVKPTWIHCDKCKKCTLEKHRCGIIPITGKCFKCDKLGHTGKNCPDIASVKDASKSLKSRKSDLERNKIVKKRKAEKELQVFQVKKAKVKHSKKISEQKISIIYTDKKKKERSSISKKKKICKKQQRIK